MCGEGGGGGKRGRGRKERWDMQKKSHDIIPTIKTPTWSYDEMQQEHRLLKIERDCGKRWIVVQTMKLNLKLRLHHPFHSIPFQPIKSIWYDSPSPYRSIAASSEMPTVPSSRGVNTVVAMFWGKEKRREEIWVYVRWGERGLRVRVYEYKCVCVHVCMYECIFVDVCVSVCEMWVGRKGRLEEGVGWVSR